jgi:hypothetical protein
MTALPQWVGPCLSKSEAPDEGGFDFGDAGVGLREECVIQAHIARTAHSFCVERAGKKGNLDKTVGGERRTDFGE